jgi:DNA-binding CsgD family transcriptional regulator
MSARPELGTPLSERELEILKLAAGALSNRQIAEKLFISVRTVDTHLHHVYAKTGTSNRVQATNWFLEAGR